MGTSHIILTQCFIKSKHTQTIKQIKQYWNPYDEALRFIYMHFSNQHLSCWSVELTRLKSHIWQFEYNLLYYKQAPTAAWPHCSVATRMLAFFTLDSTMLDDPTIWRIWRNWLRKQISRSSATAFQQNSCTSWI